MRRATRALGARLHGRGGVAHRRLGAARRDAAGRADGRRLGMARVHRRGLDRRVDQPLLRRPAARRGDDGLLATVEPVVTVLLAMLVFGESLGAVQVVVGALVLAAVVALQVQRATVPDEATATIPA
jgi:hypothetical protein